MSDLHIEDFYKDVATIFLRLYQSFPRKCILYVDDVCGVDTPDEFGLPSDRYMAGFSAMVWLAEQDYLKFDSTIRHEALDQAVLTEKGFLLLTTRSELDFSVADSEDELPPSLMEQSQTNINQIRQALGTKSSIIIRQCVHYLLSQPAGTA